MHARHVDFVQRHDRPGQLALQCALVVHFLRELGQPQVGILEQFQPHHVLQAQIAAHQLDAGGAAAVFRNQDGAVVLVQSEGNLFLLQFGDHRAGIGRFEIGEKRLVAGRSDR